jgi:small subunit ribosomal protein S21
MIIINVSKEKNIESALKKFRNKFKKYGVKNDLIENKEFVKKSVKKRKQKIKAQYIQSLKDKEIDR